MVVSLFIGVGGISGGGKTTLTCQLEKTLENVVVIHMDDYYQLTTPIPEYDSFYNWDCLESVDWNRMMNDINGHLGESLEKSITVVIEGTMVLNYKPLQNYLSHRIFFTLPHSEALIRRRLTYVGREPEDYFDQYVWPAFIECYNELRGQSDLVFIDGRQPLDEIHRTVSDCLLRQKLP